MIGKLSGNDSARRFLFLELSIIMEMFRKPAELSGKRPWAGKTELGVIKMKKAILILTAGLLAAGSMAASAVAAQVDYEEFWGPYSTNPETEDHYLFQINPDSLLLYWEHEEPELFQTITFPAPLPDVEFCLERMKTSDLNHDGYEDLCIPSTMDETPPFLKNYCYL